MCLVTKQKEAIILVEDMEVLKPLLLNFKSIYYRYQYKLGKTNKTEINFETCEWGSSYDNQSTTLLRTTYGEQWYLNPDFVAIANGFHSGSNLSRFISNYQFYRSEAMICNAIIPAGSEFYTDNDGLFVSNQLIVTDIKSYL